MVWVGNTPAIAIGHYLQVTDTHFAKAVGVTCTPNLINKPDIDSLGVKKNNAKSDAHDVKTTQNPTHRGGSEMFAEVQELIEIEGNIEVLAGIVEELQKQRMPRVGIEPTTS